jgi:hypothetical protein
MRYNNTIRWIMPDAAGADPLELQIDWDAGEAVVHLEVPGAAEGGPATAHGGFLAALADHVMGFVRPAGRQASGYAPDDGELPCPDADVHGDQSSGAG